jgi:hypothetical protein
MVTLPQGSDRRRSRLLHDQSDTIGQNPWRWQDRWARVRSAMKVVGEIERIDPADQAAMEDRIARGRPVIVAGAVHDWPACAKWTPSYLRRVAGDAPLEFRLSPSGVHPPIDGSTGAVQILNRRCSLSDFLTLMVDSPLVFVDGNLAKLRARDGSANQQLAPLLTDVERPRFIDQAAVDTISLWLSGAGVRTRLHHDRNGKNNFVVQVLGSKRVTVVSPEQASYLYPVPITSPFYHFTQVDNFNPDLDLFPCFSRVEALEGVLSSGDLLLLPAYWYHSFTHLGEVNINVNFWVDAPAVPLSAVALRNELAAILTTADVAGSVMPEWEELLAVADERCLRWSPNRPG